MAAPPVVFALAFPRESGVTRPAEIAALTARSTARAASAWPRRSTSSAAVRIAPTGLAMPLPAMSGAVPCTGS